MLWRLLGEGVSMRDLELTERYATRDGVVRWTRMGKGDPVVLLHGTPFSSVVWSDIAAALARTHEVYVWDMLGYGRSEMRDGQHVSLAAQQEIFASLLDHWDLDEPSVVAHDFGGAVALRTHLLSGVRYRALALVDPVALAPWGSPFFRLVRENVAVFGQLPEHLHAALVREYVGSASGPGLHPASLERLVRPWLDGAGQAAFYRQIAQADQRYTDEIESRYSTLDLPVLVCWGADDTWLPVAKGEQLAGAIPGARLRRIPGAGHLVQEDAPAELTAALLEFLGDR
jgi:pimeloyl-ACP methyl ester carboxylesterase